MSKKPRKKSGQATRVQQQQQAAARRHIAPAAADRGLAEAPQQRASEPVTRRPRSAQRHYLDVSAIRIQEWLARTPDLKYRRGASVLLTEATARGAWEASPPAGTTWNDEAGDVGGVVSLVITDDIAEPDVRVCAAAAASYVARSMRERMPHCFVQAVTGTGDSYVSAYPQMEQARRDGRFVVDAPPAPAEVILAKPCDQCRSAAATHKQVPDIASEKPRDLCADCRNRLDAAGRTSADKPDKWPIPEQRLKDALEADGATVTGFSRTFAEMASAGQREQDNAATQLALIYADGNRVGGFLSKAAALASPGGKLRKTEIVKAIDDATVGALADAVAERFAGNPEPPVLVNLAGGDDILVSVPAADAWTFTCTLLSAFGRRIREAGNWPDSIRRELPTLSAGLVFHHTKDPFSDVVRLAEDQLNDAKKAGRGLEAMVSFLDLTADGGHAPPERHPLRLAYLEKHADDLARIEQIPKSRIATLQSLYRQGAPEDVTRLFTDRDNQPLWDVLVGPGATPEQVRKFLAEERSDRHGELRRLLDLARNWIAQPAEAAA
jgi:hypothetical protein